MPAEVCWSEVLAVTPSGQASIAPMVLALRFEQGDDGEECHASGNEVGWEFGICCHCRIPTDRN